MQDLQPAIYILASGRNGTLYVGVTGDLVKRAWQHRSTAVSGFSARYGVHLLVHYELHGTMEHAITREKRLKKWDRAWEGEVDRGGQPGVAGSLERHPGKLWIPACAGMTGGRGE